MSEKKYPKSYDKMPAWECYPKQLDVEYVQSVEEGKDIEKYKALFDAVIALENSPYKEELSDVLFGIVSEAKQREEYEYEEPSDYESILDERKPFEAELKYPDDGILSDKVLGGWYGRICGCLLGKPVEGIRSYELEKVLKRTGNYPMRRYITKEEITPDVADGISYPIAQCAYPSDFGRMPCDDDTNYMVIGYRVLQCCGKDFTPDDVARMWLGTQVKNAYCTAERIAYKNFLNGYYPPYSASYKNPYREWIGAQIRGDFFGYVNPCDCERAADMAFRDACISHIKNGIYGEMWVSAMIAAAYGCDDIEKIIRCGMAQIPAKSRLYEALEKTIKKYNDGVSEEEAFADIHARWDEEKEHDWVHTISNAEIVAASLLYGGKDYAKSVGMAVATGFDTDCNGATVGSILGVCLGYEALPHEFTDFIKDTLDSNISGFSRVSVKDMAKRTLAIIKGEK